ncbi:MAG: ATP-binding protein [Anaerolineales bacterium]|nr:ATP-binding protein [Anaerolineales bacterium]MDW8162239.1 ATP-binding protein [Anaerolineales bacterium]
MQEFYISRTLEATILRAAAEFPAVVLVGPRQSGKTTLLKHLFGGERRLISLELPDVRLAAEQDPRTFLRLYSPPVILDEIQYAPILLPYIKERIDQNRHQSGQYILTGSQNILLMDRVSESLAGRAAVLKLFPLTCNEINDQPQRPFPWQTPEFLPTQEQKRNHWQQILRGSFPEIVSQPGRDIQLWYASYLQTYLERDIRLQREIGDLTRFQTFLRLLAFRVTQLLNLSDLAREVGSSVNTIKEWLSLLEANMQIFFMRPFARNLGKRLVKSPKVYFTDSGLLCYLLGLRDVHGLAAGPLSGAVFENYVIAEIYKRKMHQAEECLLYFWRTSSGQEVDLVIEDGHRLIPIEIKQTATPFPDLAKGLVAFKSLFAEQVTQSYLIHSGDQILPLGKDILAIPLSSL